MKQSQNGRRGRSRSGGRKPGKGQDPNRSEIKVRGNPKQLLEKYKNPARDAQQSGDRVLAEHNLQFADHYQRVLNEMRGLTRGLFSGDYVVVERENRAVEDEETEDTGEVSVALEGDEEQAQSQPRRPRRPRRNTVAAHQSGDGGDEAPAVSANGRVGASEEQPPEVHPELELNREQPAADEAPPKPRRPRRPRRTPAASPENTAPPQESGTA